MMMLSGVWYSLESASDWLQQLAHVFPLTHVLNAARSIMLDGASIADIAPQLLALVAMSAVFLSIAAGIFRWRSN
jgi:ABC-type multidrug transport system permease subunit